MPSRVSNQQLSKALFSSIRDRTYPEDEEIVSAELPSSALQNLSQLLEQARGEVKASIRELSKLSASDIDGWIIQAKQLRGDIEQSKREAKEIVTSASIGKDLENKAKDSASKVHLLKNELAFNESLSSTLQRVQELKETVDRAQEALIGHRIQDATSSLQHSESLLANLSQYRNTVLAGLLQAKITDIRDTLADALRKYWDSLVLVESDRISVRSESKATNGVVVDFETVVSALGALELLKGKVIEFKKHLDSVILTPRLRSHGSETECTIEVEGRTIKLIEERSDNSVRNLLSDVNTAMEWLASALPAPIAKQVIEGTLNSLISRLVSDHLPRSVPQDLSGIPEFQKTLLSVENFAESLGQRNWPGYTGLVEWIKDAPKVWLARRSNSSMDSIRQLLVRGIGKPRAVERVETQTVGRGDGVFLGNSGNDEWDAPWSDEEDGTGDPLPTGETVQEKQSPIAGTEEEDIDAWGWSEDDNKEDTSTTTKQTVEQSNDDEDVEESWGWGNDDDDTASPAKEAHSTKPDHENNTINKIKAPDEREITLRETYHITALPEQIFEIIIQAIDDADRLSHVDIVSNPVAPAAAGLYALPGLLLSMYRAVAPNFYGQDINGNMFLYNDSLYLAEQLRLFAAHHESHSQADLSEKKFDITDDAAALELFGKRAYGKEMELQRTVISDMLDGAQGFANCTEHPFAQECDIAISSTVDRLRAVHSQWQHVLSISALLQSIGSLVSTVTNKMLVEIEDMSDISEPESQRLAGFCKRIIALEDLFSSAGPEGPGVEGQHSAIAAAVYIPGLLKFQYLSEILESSLADIKYLWTEGELSLEFSTEEVVELIEALFADSDHRRRAISEIKKSGRRG